MTDHRWPTVRVILAVLTMGFSGIVAQILLLRELLVSFQGNELSIGVILANWLILEAAGAFLLGPRAESRRFRIESFVVIQTVFCLFLPVAVYLSRTIKTTFGITPGESLGLLSIIGLSFLVLSSVSIAHGALFTLSCRLYEAVRKQTHHASSIGRVYVIETIGTLVGGVFFTYLLVPHFNSLRIALGITAFNLIVCLILLSRFWKSRRRFTRILGFACLSLSLLVCSIVCAGLDHRIHKTSVARQWLGQDVIHYENSKYGNVVVTEREEQYVFFADGIPIITTPIPDIEFVEEFVHLPMLIHSDPKEVLIISGGAGGIIREILKHPVERIDYVELDPLLLKLVKKYSTSLTDIEFCASELRIHHLDGRFFVTHFENKYDLIFIGLGDPQDLQTNRLYTTEFFLACRGRLNDDGILVLKLSGSLTYLSAELINLNRCILNTLHDVFPHVRTIPGDVNFYLASQTEAILLPGDIELAGRMTRRDLETRLLTPFHLTYKLHPRWLEWFVISLDQGTEKKNEDFRPIAAFYSLAYWNAVFTPHLRWIFKYFEGISLRLFLILSAGLALLFLGLGARMRNVAAAIPFCIATTGFAGMLFDLVLIFAFQILYGYVFYWIGVIVSALMVGMAAGGYLATTHALHAKDPVRTFVHVDLLIILFSILLPLVLTRTGFAENRPLFFLPLALLSGLLVGLEFPLGSHIYLSTGRGADLGHTAGLLYGADLMGGWLAGVLGGIFFLPLLGVFGSCMVLVMLKLSTLVFLLSSVLPAKSASN
ncbi:fused MFS/spermidine synthase [candidate division WOR-3 bacterium]|nr:fused MFS/spermidine synthase [candidate division WOR-3 bacterium]